MAPVQSWSIVLPKRQLDSLHPQTSSPTTPTSKNGKGTPPSPSSSLPQPPFLPGPIIDQRWVHFDNGICLTLLPGFLVSIRSQGRLQKRKKRPSSFLEPGTFFF